MKYAAASVNRNVESRSYEVRRAGEDEEQGDPDHGRTQGVQQCETEDECERDE